MGPRRPILAPHALPSRATAIAIRLAAAVPVLVLVVGAWLGSATAIGAAVPPLTMLYIDSPTGDSIGNGRIYTIVSPADGELQGGIGAYRPDEPGAGVFFIVFPTDPNNYSHWEVDLQAPAGQTLVPGHYEAGSDPYGSGAYLFVGSDNGCGAPVAMSFDILQATFDADGKPTSFAASFAFNCATDALHGEVRLNSTVPLVARQVAPRSLDFGIVDVGATSASKSITVTNAGNASLAAHAGTVMGDYKVTSDGCTGKSIAPGASCTIAVAFKPSTHRSRPGSIDIVDNTAAAHRLISLAGGGITTTTTTLTASSDTNVYPEGRITFTATVSPPPAGGTVKIFGAGSGPSSVHLSSAGVATWIWFTSVTGSAPIYVVYQADTYFKSSTSNTVVIHTVLHPQIQFVASPVQAPVGYPVEFKAVVQGAGSGGTITVDDDTTGLHLPIVTPSGGGLSAENCFTPAAGPHHLHAHYSGHDDVTASDAYVDVTIGPPDVVLGPVDTSSDLAELHCANMITSTGSIHVQDPNQQLVIYAIGNSHAFTDIRLSFDGAIGPDYLLAKGATYPYGVPSAISLTDSSLGAPSGDGQRELWMQFRNDVGHWTPAAVSILVLDRSAPSGTVQLAGNAPGSGGEDVSLAVNAQDALSPVAAVALSNDGSTWDQRPYAETESWTLDGAEAGEHTVWAKWQDEAGNWSDPVRGQILVDTVAPYATSPAASIIGGTALVSGAVPVRLVWSGADDVSGINHYEIARSTDGGSWTSVSAAVPTGSTTINLKPDHSYAFRVRAVDGSGNSSIWATGSSFRLTATQDSAKSISYRKSWATSRGSVYWGGSAKQSSARGATASLRMTGRSIAWISRLGPSRGVAKVYVNGTHVATIDLKATGWKSGRIVWTATWSSSAIRTVVVKVSGTIGRPRVDLDGFIVLR